MDKYIEISHSLPDVTTVHEDYNESGLVLCLVFGKHRHLAKLNTGIGGDGEKWSTWYCPAFEDFLEYVTHWCHLPDLPIK